jgi:hypothetical protein
VQQAAREYRCHDVTTVPKGKLDDGFQRVVLSRDNGALRIHGLSDNEFGAVEFKKGKRYRFTVEELPEQ